MKQNLSEEDELMEKLAKEMIKSGDVKTAVNDKIKLIENSKIKLIEFYQFF